MSYRTFLRNATNWEEFATAEKVEVDTDLTYEEARAACAEFNENRSATEIATGTKMEFEEE